MSPGRPKKLRLSRSQREVLWMLGEAGAENLPTVLNTLRVHFPAESREDLLQLAREAIHDLYRAGFVALEPESTGQDSALSAMAGKGLPALDEMLAWDESAGAWRWDARRAGPSRMVLVLTEAGQRVLRT